MEDISVKGLKRNPEVIKSYFNVKGDITTVTDDIMVIFPERYINRKLATIGNVVTCLSMYAILDGQDNYAITNVPIIQTLTPSTIGDCKINGDNYKLLSFDAGSVFLPSNKLIVRDNFIYDIFDEFFVKGKLPWYYNYHDVANMFLESKTYAGSRIGSDPLIFEMLTAIISRLPEDKKVYFRTIAGENNINPVYVGLNNVYYSFDNTAAKIIGSRMGAGINVALVEPEKKSSATADILRS